MIFLEAFGAETIGMTVKIGRKAAVVARLRALISPVNQIADRAERIARRRGLFKVYGVGDIVGILWQRHSQTRAGHDTVGLTQPRGYVGRRRRGGIS